MRTTILLLAIAVSTTVASAATFEARSLHYVLTIKGVEGRYTVRVATLDNNEVFAEDIAALPREITRDIGDLHFAVALSSGPSTLNAILDVEQGEMLIDSIHTTWSIAPLRAHIRVPGAMRVGGDVRAPIVVNRVEPRYTEEARKNRVSGITILEVLIDKTGIVRDAIVLKPLPFGLSDSALAAVRQWTFPRQRDPASNCKPDEAEYRRERELGPYSKLRGRGVARSGRVSRPAAREPRLRARRFPCDGIASMIPFRFLQARLPLSGEAERASRYSHPYGFHLPLLSALHRKEKVPPSLKD